MTTTNTVHATAITAGIAANRRRRFKNRRMVRTSELEVDERLAPRRVEHD